jgi:hypothetical protein
MDVDDLMKEVRHDALPYRLLQEQIKEDIIISPYDALSYRLLQLTIVPPLPGSGSVL